jgi:hypothetical protein
MRVAAAQEAERMRGEQEKRDEQHRRQVEQARAREAAAPAKAAAPAPARFPRPGTSWIYRYEDRLYGRRTHRFGVHVDSISAQSVTDVLKDDGGQPTSGSFDPAEVRFAPRPIASGRTIYELAPYLDSSSPPPVSSWQQIAGTISGVPVDAWQFRVLSIAREMVKVPAGTFDALRVEIEGQRRADVAELTQGVRFTMDVQRFRYVAWYASDVRRYVMSHLREWPALGRPQTTDEVVQLVEYRLSTN